MPYTVYLNQSFAGASGTALDTLSGWPSDTNHYVGVAAGIVLNGAGGLYGAAGSGAAEIPSAAAPTANNFEVLFSFLRQSALSGSISNLEITTHATYPGLSPFAALRWLDGTGTPAGFSFDVPGVGSPPSNAGPAIGTTWLVRARVATTGSNTTFSAAFSANAGATYTDMGISVTVATSTLPTINPGFYLANTWTPSTGPQLQGPLIVQDLSATTATLSGPSSGAVSVQSTAYTVLLDRPAGTGGVVVTPSSSIGGDTFQGAPGGSNATTVTIAQGATTGTFYLTPDATTGTRNISIATNPGLTLSGSPAPYTAGGGGTAPTQATLTGPSAGPAAAQSTAFAVTLDNAAVGTVTVTPTSSTVGDTFQASPGGGNVSTIAISSGQTAGTFYLTPTAAGFRNVSIATSPTLTYAGTPIDYGAGIANGYTVGGASSAVVGVVSAPITVTPNGFVSGTDTVTLALVGVAGALSSTTLTFSNSTAPQQVTLNATSSGMGFATAGSSHGLAIPTSPWSLDVMPASLPVTFVTSLQLGITGLAGGFTLTPLAYDGAAVSTPPGGATGTVREIMTSGTYVCTVTYQSSQLPAGTWPVVSWAASGASYSDPQPIPLTASTAAWAAPYYRAVEVLF